MKHTPGPWELCSHKHGSHKTVTKGANNLGIVLMGKLEDGSVGEANAQLIAAAPDMYKLLNDILGWDGILGHSKTRIRNILSKAEGGK